VQRKEGKSILFEEHKNSKVKIAKNESYLYSFYPLPEAEKTPEFIILFFDPYYTPQCLSCHEGIISARKVRLFSHSSLITQKKINVLLNNKF